MPRIQRTSDVIEVNVERAVYYIGGEIVSALVGVFFWTYFRKSGYGNVAIFFFIAAAGMVAYALYWILQNRRVAHEEIKCPYCLEVNELTEKPKDDDIACVACNRMIPILNGIVLPVSQVRCGYCNGLNYYSAKTEVLICEHCNREVLLHGEDGAEPKKKLNRAFIVTDDNQMYELVLTEVGRSPEEVITALQHMLALNRNQVKDIIENTPVSLMQGINKMKADMLSAQLSASGAKSEVRVLAQV